MISAHTSNKTTAISSLFNFFIGSMDGTFLNNLPTAVKGVIALLIVSIIFYVFIISICLLIGILNRFSIEIHSKERTNIFDKLKFSVCFVLGKIKNPDPMTPFLKGIWNSFPIIIFICILLSGWKAMLPMLVVYILASKPVENKLHYKMNFWLLGFLIFIAIVAYQLSEYSS